MLTALMTTALALAFTASATAAAPPQVGVLTGTSGCQMIIDGSVGCTPVRGIAEGEAAVVSPDGRNVYVTSFSSTTPSASAGLAAFSRDPLTGGLAQLPGTSGCVTGNGNSRAGAGTCTAVPSYGAGGDSANIAITPDGKFVYVVSSNIILIFGRDPSTGALTQPAGAAGCVTPTGSGPCQTAPDLADPQDVSISPDGRFLYVSELSPTGILVLSRDASTGALSEVQCLFNAPAPTACDIGRDVGVAEPVVISPDGLHAFSSQLNTGISSLSRDPVSGRLTQPAGAAGCISEDATDGQGGVCTQGRFLEDLVSLAISPDGHTLYAATNDSPTAAGVAVVHVASDGSLSQPAGSQACITNNGHDQTGAANCSTGHALDGAIAVAVSPDGRTLYVANDPGNGGDGVATLSISASTGALSQPDGTAGCTTADGSAGGVLGVCGSSGSAMNTPGPGAVSPDGTSLYVPESGSNALIGFRRETAPVCAPVTASTAFDTAVTISLSCSDADGDPVSMSIATDPAHGTLGPVNQTGRSVRYTPTTGYHGSDSFMFSATDGTNTGDAQTATITVNPQGAIAPPPPLPRFSKVHQTHKRWREPGKAKKHAPPVGTTFSFTLNTAARVTLTFRQRLPGRKVGRRCAAPSRHNRGRHACTRTTKRGSVSFAGVAGSNQRAFNGAIAHHGRLPIGSYTVTLTAATAPGRHAAPKTLRFTIVA
jgi:DNA-binding beta-propeller fold protein YncE